MNYLEKINAHLVKHEVATGESVTVPHQAFSPREILSQFVQNDVQVQQREPTDNIHVQAVDDIGRRVMDDDDLAEVTSQIVEFEDQFEAAEAVRRRTAYKRKRKEPDKEPDKEPKKEPDKEPAE